MKKYLVAVFLLVVLTVTSYELLKKVKSTAKQASPQAVAKHILLAPEFMPAESVIISEVILNENFNGLELGKGILDAGAKLIILVSDTMGTKEQAKWLNKKGFTPEEQDNIQIINVSHDSQWVRDYGPLPVILGFDNLPEGLGFVDLVYKSNAFLDDTVPYQLGLFLNSNISHVPLDFDGGNFLTDGRNCYMTTDVRKQLLLTDKNIEYDRERANRLIDRYFKTFAGCQNVVLFEDTAHEHIDMLAKIVTPDTVVVSEVDRRTLDLLKRDGQQVPRDVMDLKNSLDAMAKQFSKYLNVVRVPIPVPYRNILRNYTNGLIVNDHMIVPSYRHYGWKDEKYPDDDLHAYYEAEAEKVFGRWFKVSFVNADPLIFNGGALHCVTAQLPKLRKVARRP